MNEIISKLYDKSYCMAIDEADDKNFIQNHMNLFAELIVQECVSTLETKIDEGDGYGSYEEGIHRGFIGARNMIKKHFRVE